MFNKTRAVKRFVRRNKFRALLVVTAALGLRTMYVTSELNRVDAALAEELKKNNPDDYVE